jgi:DNA-binding IclR family transcriptional regulator
VGRAGWVQTVEEREPGVASVSAPVRDADGVVVAAISVSGPIDRMGRTPGRRCGDAVLGAAGATEAAIRGRLPGLG